MSVFRHSLILFTLVVAWPVYGEEINLFESVYEVHPDGAVEVTETIQYDFSDNQRRGIFRLLETTHAQPASTFFKERLIEIQVHGVTRDGQEEPFRVEQRGDELEIRIGDPDVTITGPHSYRIHYTLIGALSYGPQGVELYHNVTGNGWEVPINEVVARISGVEGVVFTDQRACYQGGMGSTESCAEITTDGEVTVMSSRPLGPAEGLTIAQALDPESVAVVVIERTIPFLPFVALFVLYVLSVTAYIFRFRRWHKPEVPFLVQYEPYPDTLPMYAGVLIDGQLDSKDITAGIIYLAEQGFLKITREERKVLGLFTADNYRLTLLRPASDAPTVFSHSVLHMLFKDQEVGEQTSLHELRNDTSRQLANSQVLAKLRSALSKDLYERGFFEAWSRRDVVSLTAGMVIVIAGAVFSQSIPLIFIGTLLTLIVYACALWGVHRRRTPKGFEALNHLKGFKHYLSVAEKDRISFHNAPAKNPEQFLAFLPYAIAFGVEKEWAAVFRDVTIPNPGWYEGSSVHSFSAVALSSELSSFSSAVGSSGAAGSSGGGSSGGGGGGGGGGSW